MEKYKTMIYQWYIGLNDEKNYLYIMLMYEKQNVRDKPYHLRIVKVTF